MSEVLNRFDVWDEANRPNPHLLYAEMRKEAPVYEGIGPVTGRSFWFLTKHDDVVAAFNDRRLGRDIERLPETLRDQHRFPNEDMLRVMNTHMLNMDPPDHTRLRRLVSSTFTPKRVRELAPRIEEMADDLLGGLGGDADLIHDYALPIPVMVIAELLGVPIDDLDEFRATVDGFLRAEDEAASMAAGMTLLQYINESIEEKRAAPGDDLLSALIHHEEDGDRLSNIELTSMVNLLLIAGHETTVNLIGNGMLELMRHPDQMDELRAHPDLIDSAVEEMVRYNGPVETPFPRFVYEDIEMRGQTIKAGDMVIPVLLAANHDPDVFEDPEAFLIDRDPNKHVGFGFGIHFCLGAPLARLEAKIAISRLLERFDSIDMRVPDTDLTWNPGFFLRGVRSLPVALS